MDLKNGEEFVHRFAAAARAAGFYNPTHPIVRQSVEALATNCDRHLKTAASFVIGFLGDEVVVDDRRLPKSAALVGFVRQLHDRQIEKITFLRGITRDEIQGFVEVLSERSAVGVMDRLAGRRIHHVSVGVITVENNENPDVGMAAAKRMYFEAVGTAEALWNQAQAGDQPDPTAARTIIDSLAKVVTEDRTSLMALTALKKYDNYTFTHMVNVSVLTMAQARGLNITGPLLREFGLAALMHDIGKVHTPVEVLNKPGKLTPSEFEIMKRHVVDGAHILRRTPEMPALTPIVAFEHHLKQDLSGYPEKIGHRNLNLCTMLCSIADVFDALRSNRPYRQGMATDRVRALLVDQTNPAFQSVLLKRASSRTNILRIR
jgi:putative nucleotidyltransferase with HDIG domain